MLDDHERARIRLEEQYRAEIRASLGTGRSNRIWTFLNSSFGLWLMSALFLSVLGSVYNRYADERQRLRISAETKLQSEREMRDARAARDEKRRDEIQKLDTEISYSYSQVLLRLDMVMRHPSTRWPKSPESVVRAFALLSLPPRDEYPPLNPEFAAHALPTLLLELQRRVDTKNDRDQIQVVLRLLSTNMGLSAPPEDVDTLAMRAAAIVQKDLMLPRWKDGRFPYTDCTSEEPLCQ